MTRRDRCSPGAAVIFLRRSFIFRVCSCFTSHARLKNIPGSRPTTQPRVHVSARGRHRSVLSRALSAPRAPSALAIYELASRASCQGPPEVAVLMICSSEDPTTTKMKKPSITGPTENPYLLFCLALMSTIPLVDVLAVAIVAGAHDALGDGAEREGARGEGRAKRDGGVRVGEAIASRGKETPRGPVPCFRRPSGPTRRSTPGGGGRGERARARRGEAYRGGRRTISEVGEVGS